MNKPILSLFDGYDELQFQDIMSQYNLLAEWMSTTFPEVRFRLDVHQNEVEEYIEFKTTIHTQKEMSLKDSLLRQNKIVISKELWYDKVKMSKLIKGLLPGLQLNISRAINEWLTKMNKVN